MTRNGKQLEIGPDRLRDLPQATRQEWLETNGLGSYASSTVCGMNTRRYHGLLVAAARPPVGRCVLLAKVEETLFVGDRTVPLSVNRYEGTTHPDGHLRLVHFTDDPFPTTRWRVDDVTIERTIFMPRGRHAAVITYRRVGGGDTGPIHLEVRPQVAFRDYHSLGREAPSREARCARSAEARVISGDPALPRLHLTFSDATVDERRWWYRGLRYDAEAARGFDFIEDLHSPCGIRFALRPGTDAVLIAATEPIPAAAAAALRAAELRRRRALVPKSATEPRPIRALRRAADAFLVHRGEHRSILAGFPWFSDWGRDAMIALPGLLVATNRLAEARAVLLAFADAVSEGMLPNRFPDSGEAPEYNTVDATLWFFEAIRAWHAASRDDVTLRARLLPVLDSIVDWHVRGTRHGIRVDDDGLLRAGEPGVQLTWMDAKVGNRVITPRTGKAVEVQALWFNATCSLRDLARRLGCRAMAARAATLADRARRAFGPAFWNPGTGCLFDVVGDGAPDPAIRPNQLLAVSLRHALVRGPRAKSIVAVVERELRTPYGLRTLSPADARYVGRYEGGPEQRDSAYHQGTVWPWLMGPFVDAYLAAHGRTRTTVARAMRWLEPLLAFAAGEGLSFLPEVFDGDAPQRAGGCFAQAWSVGEVLRVALSLRSRRRTNPSRR